MYNTRKIDHQTPKFPKYYPKYQESKKNSIKNSIKMPKVLEPHNDITNHRLKDTTPFWLENPNVLFQTSEIISNDDMSQGARLNAMTRIIIIIAAIMYAIKFPLWWLFLIISILVVIIIWFIEKQNEIKLKERLYLRAPREKILTPIKHPPKFNLISLY